MRRIVSLQTSAGIVGLLAIVGSMAGCGVEEIEDHPCPPAGTSLSYATFGQPFFAQHCVECHGGAESHSSRAFVTVESIRASKGRIFANAAAGNVAMPPGPDDPGEDERGKLAEWLACGAP